MIRKGLSKRNAAIILTGVLSLAMASAVMAAPQGPGGNGGPGGRGGMQGGFSQRGQMPTFEEGERPEIPEFEEGERPEIPEFEEGERPELPELEEGERPEPPTGQRTETDDENRPELPEGEMSERPEMKEGQKMKGIDIESIQTAIDDLDDGDIKSALEALLEEYSKAKTALDTAIEDESDDIDTYRKTEMDAMKALREALDEAGIDTRPELTEGERGEAPERFENNGSCGKSGQMEEQIARGSEERSDKIGQKSSNTAFDRISNWFGSFFDR